MFVRVTDHVVLYSAARHIYRIPDWFHHVLMTVKIVGKSTVENYLEWYIGLKLEQVTQEHRLVDLINLLRGKWGGHSMTHGICSQVCGYKTLVHMKQDRVFAEVI